MADDRSSGRTRHIQVEIFAGQESGKQQLEANLTLDLTDAATTAGTKPHRQPLFLALTKLRHSSSYLVRLAQSAEVQFGTEPGQDEAEYQPPSVQLIGSETNRAHLMSTLISVRSTNGQSAASVGGSAGAASEFADARWPPRPETQQTGSLTGRLFASLADTIDSLFHNNHQPSSSSNSHLAARQQLPRRQQQQQQQQRPSSNLMDLSDTFLLTSLACLTLLLMVGLSLVLLHRYSSWGATRDRSSCSLASSSTLSSPPPLPQPSIGQVKLHQEEHQFYSAKKQDPDCSPSSSGNSSAPSTQLGAGPLTGEADHQRSAAPLQLFACRPAAVATATATLDMRKLASMRRQCQPKNETTTSTCPSSQLYYSAASTASESSPMAAHVSKSRSSMCLESLAIERPHRSSWLQQQHHHDHHHQQSAGVACNANRCATSSSTHLAGAATCATADQQQQQQQHYHLELDSAHLISDANSSSHFGRNTPQATYISAAPSSGIAGKCRDYEQMTTTMMAAAAVADACAIRSMASGIAADHRSSSRSSSVADACADGHLTNLAPANLTSLHRLSRCLPAADSPAGRYAAVSRRRDQFPGPHSFCRSSSSAVAADGSQETTDVTVRGGGGGLLESPLVAFDESQVQFIELLPTTATSASAKISQQHSAADDSLMIQQQQQPFIYDANLAASSGEHQYLTIATGQANHLQLVDGRADNIITGQQQRWFFDNNNNNNSNNDDDAQRIHREQQLKSLDVSGQRTVAFGSSVASSSLGSSSLNDQPISTSPLSSPQTNTTPSNSNTDQEAKLQRVFYETSSMVRSANRDGNTKRCYQQQQQQQNRPLGQGILKKTATTTRYDSNIDEESPSDTALTCLCDDPRAASKH